MIPPGLPEAVQDTDVSVLLHLSDPHFGAEEPAALKALLALAEQERPDVVVASGDITQRARAEEFDAAQRFFERLYARHVLVVPGARDIPLWDLPQRVLAPFAGFRRVFGDNLEPRLMAPFVWIAGLVSPRRWRRAYGALSRDQVLRTAQWLEAAPPGVLKVVTVHHPVAAMHWYDEDDVLTGAAEALARWAEAGVHVVLGGHTHRPYALAVRPTAGGPGLALWVAQAGSAISRRVDPGGTQSVNLLRRSATGMWRIEQWDLRREAGTFARCRWRQIGVQRQAL